MFDKYFFVVQRFYVGMNFGTSSIGNEECSVRTCRNMLNI